MTGVVVVNTNPYKDQITVEFGLHRKVKVFRQENYTENFIQIALQMVKHYVKGSTIVVGGDGRYLLKEVVDKIIKICAANKVSKVIIGQNGILSTPAVAHIMRRHLALGGFFLTASHNPGDGDDFGLQFKVWDNMSAYDDDEYISELFAKIEEYRIVPDIVYTIDKVGVQSFFVEDHIFAVEVIDSVADYVDYMKEIFDFPKIKTLLQGSEQRKPFNVLIDSMNGVTGPYVQRIFVEELGASSKNVTRTTPLEDFGGIRSDPNLTYASDLVNAVKEGDYDFGAAFDGDGDRNMIIGRGAFFVTPSDSLAVLANNLEHIPYFQKKGVKYFARTMPTSAAVDHVANKKGKSTYVVPTGYKHIRILWDMDRISLWGEENFRTGSDHMRENDGIWAALAWLSVLAATGKSVEETLKAHWLEFGRNYFTRYDYEECDPDTCNQMMQDLEQKIIKESFERSSYSAGGKTYVEKPYSRNFSYLDQIFWREHVKQGLTVKFEDGSHIALRLSRRSGTSSSGATVRLYVDAYEPTDVLGDPQEMLAPLVHVALDIFEVHKYTGRSAPSFIT